MNLTLTILKEKSSYTILQGCVPSDLQLVKIFGCLCYSDLQNIAAHKLSSQLLPCVFLGLFTKHKGFCCLYSSTGKIFYPDMLLFLNLCFLISVFLNFPPLQQWFLLFQIFKYFQIFFLILLYWVSSSTIDAISGFYFIHSSTADVSGTSSTNAVPQSISLSELFSPFSTTLNNIAPKGSQ